MLRSFVVSDTLRVTVAKLPELVAAPTADCSVVQEGTGVITSGVDASNCSRICKTLRSRPRESHVARAVEAPR